MPNILIRPPVRPSNGAQTVRQALGAAARLSRRNPIPRWYNKIINWGNSTPIQTLHPNATIFNKPEAIINASNKLRAFQKMSEAAVSIPEYTATAPTVLDGQIWFARTQVQGSGGEGIVVIRHGDSVPVAPLYVRYVRKTAEFRIHVCNGTVIFVQQKRRKSGLEQSADQKLIRNHGNGWVFCPVELDQVQQAWKDEAVKATQALGLDFGAVDCIVGRGDGRLYVLELNTAPGLESPGLIAAYTQAFQEMTR